MKKILVIHTKYKHFGGEDSNIVEELKFLEEKYNVEYIEFNNSDKLNLFDYIGFFTNSNINSNKKLKLVLKEFKPDIVYIHNTWFKAGLKLFKIVKNYKTIVKIHNFRFECTKSMLGKKHLNKDKYCLMCGFNGGIFNKYFENSYLKSLLVLLYGKLYYKILINGNLKIIVLTQFQKNFLIEKGFNPNKIEVIYNPIRFTLNNKLYNSSSSYVVYAGLLTKQKGVLELISAWNSTNNTDLELRLIGKPSIDLFEDNLPDNIHLLGAINHAETISQIKNSRAVVTATRMFEGQPRLLNEASSLGIPSIFPKFGGMSEFFPENYPLAFEQFNYGDLTKKLNYLQNESQLRELSSIVYDYLENLLNSETIYSKFDNFIESF